MATDTGYQGRAPTGCWTQIILICIILGLSLLLLTAPLFPKCQEDQVLVGVGEFEDGRWSGYDCGQAVDDYTTPTRR